MNLKRKILIPLGLLVILSSAYIPWQVKLGSEYPLWRGILNWLIRSWLAVFIIGIGLFLLVKSGSSKTKPTRRL